MVIKIKYATEPLLIVEVISESTEKIDRTVKLNEYRSISSLQYYIIVEQNNCFVEIYIREGERWYVEFYEKMDEVIKLTHFDIELPLSDRFTKKFLFKKKPDLIYFGLIGFYKNLQSCIFPIFDLLLVC